MAGITITLMAVKKIDINKRETMQAILDKSRIEELLEIITKLDDQVRAEVLKAISSQLTSTTKTATLGSIKTIIQGSDSQIKDWIVNAVVDAYVEGSNVMYGDLTKLSVKPGSSNVVSTAITADMIRQIDLLSVQKEAVNALVSDFYLDFANGMNGLVRGAEHQLNEALKRQIRARTIAGQLTGQSIQKIAKDVRSVLGDQGFSVLIDRGGRQWSLKSYADMLVRTHIIKSANEGSINRYLSYGLDIVQISTHTGSCPICQQYEGKIYSISGESKEYPKLDITPPYHPRCRHTYLPRPDLSVDID